MMKTIRINLAIQQDEEESAFLVKAVKAALQAFRKTSNEERQKYDDNTINRSQPTDTVAIPHNTYQREGS
jgi:hypothetical protein